MADPRGPRLYVNADRTKIVPAGSTEAAFMMHEKDVKALGLSVTKAQVQAIEEEEEAPEEEPEAKAKEPAANKARTRGEDK